MPTLTPVRDAAGAIVDVRISYCCDFAKQMLSYSAERREARRPACRGRPPATCQSRVARLDVTGGRDDTTVQLRPGFGCVGPRRGPGASAQSPRPRELRNVTQLGAALAEYKDARCMPSPPTITHSGTTTRVAADRDSASTVRSHRLSRTAWNWSPAGDVVPCRGSGDGPRTARGRCCSSRSGRRGTSWRSYFPGSPLSSRCGSSPAREGRDGHRRRGDRFGPGPARRPAVRVADRPVAARPPRARVGHDHGVVELPIDLR